MSTQVEPAGSLLGVAEVRLGIAVGGLFGTTAATLVLGLPTPVAITAVFLQTGASCAVLRRRSAALFLGLVGWALCTGFAVNRLGVLTFAPPDIVRMVAFVVWTQVGLAAHDTMAAVRAARRRRDGWSPAQRPAAGVGVRRRSAGALAGGAGPRSAA